MKISKRPMKVSINSTPPKLDKWFPDKKIPIMALEYLELCGKIEFSLALAQGKRRDVEKHMRLISIG